MLGKASKLLCCPVLLLPSRLFESLLACPAADRQGMVQESVPLPLLTHIKQLLIVSRHWWLWEMRALCASQRQDWSCWKVFISPCFHAVRTLEANRTCFLLNCLRVRFWWVLFLFFPFILSYSYSFPFIFILSMLFPENDLLTQSGITELCDFGLA